MDRLDHYTRLDVFHGTAQELVMVGIVTASHLPAHPGPIGVPGEIRYLAGAVFYQHGQRAEYVVRIDTQPDAEHWMRIQCLSDGRYAVFKGLPRDERIRRRRASAERSRLQKSQRAKRLADQRAEDAREELARSRAPYAAMPVPRFREALADQFKRALLTLAAHTDRAVHDPSTRVLPHLLPFAPFHAVQPHLFKIVEIIEASGVLEGAGAGLAAARADEKFQQFLADPVRAMEAGTGADLGGSEAGEAGPPDAQ